jgi:hypothetical protein
MTPLHSFRSCAPLAALCLLACSTSPSAPPLDDLTGQWTLSVRWSTTPSGPQSHLDAIALALVATPTGQTHSYTGQFTGGSGACISNGQSMPMDGVPHAADSVSYSRGSLTMFVGGRRFMGVSTGTRLGGRYSQTSPGPGINVTGTWEASGPE